MKYALSIAAALIAAPGCFKAEDFVEFPNLPADAVTGPPIIGLGIGLACTDDNDCRDGLECDSTCQPAGTTLLDVQCLITAECQANAYCGPRLQCASFEPPDPLPRYKPDTACFSNDTCVAEFGEGTVCLPRPTQVCQKAGTHEVGEACTLDGDCARGLFCEYVGGLSGACATGGELDYGAKCARNADCFAGLVCGEQGQCVTWLEALQAATAWPGAECDKDDPDSPRVYFELPNASGESPSGEFYRLPYPNDIRAGRWTAGHPKPGRGPIDFDPVELLLDAANTGLSGAGTTPTVFFQFSTGIDFSSIKLEDTPESRKNLKVVNIDQDSPRFRSESGFGWAAAGRTKYLCQNWLSVDIGASSPLEPATTYASVILSGVKDTEGRLFGQDEDLAKLLADAAPGDPVAADAWAAYAPLRAWLADQGLAASEIVGAAVFTTMDPTALMRAMRTSARAQPAPALAKVVECAEGTPSPCTDPADETRVCAVHKDFVEYQGTIELPVFQSGTRPYLRPEDGGAIREVGGTPAPIGTESVCFSLTVPKGTAPEGGWPLVLYAHGTGGNFRSHVSDGTAALAATLEGTPAATLGIDQVMHGPRRGTTDLEPDVLYFNVANPAAARGNAVQSAADYFSLTLFAETFSGPLGSATVDFGPLAFVGHSQGATFGPLFASLEPSIGAVVLSGAGASVSNSLLTKTSPVNIPGAIKTVFREDAGESHPLMAILQAYFDPIDPANYAKLLSRQPPVEVTTPHPLLVTMGVGDTYTPNRTTRILADILEIPVVSPLLANGGGQPFAGYPEGRVVPGPVSGNVQVNGVATTQGLIMATPDAYDGHFVLFRDAAMRGQVSRFLATAFSGAPAEIPAPSGQPQ